MNVFFPVTFRPLITACDTRWNSHFTMLQSILKMKKVLQALRDGEFNQYFTKAESRLKLQRRVPTDDEFDVIEALLPYLEIIWDVSQQLSADLKPTLHLVLLHLVRLARLEQQVPEPSKKRYEPHVAKHITKWLRDFHNNVASRIPNFGRDTYEFNVGNLLHPAVKGRMLKFDLTLPPSEDVETDDEEVEREPEDEPPRRRSRKRRVITPVLPENNTYYEDTVRRLIDNDESTLAFHRNYNAQDPRAPGPARTMRRQVLVVLNCPLIIDLIWTLLQRELPLC